MYASLPSGETSNLYLFILCFSRNTYIVKRENISPVVYHLLVEHLGHMQLLGIRYYKFSKLSYSPEKLFQCLYHVFALAYLLTDTKVSMQLETSTIYY